MRVGRFSKASAKGYTLVELAIVIAVVGILAASAMAAIRNPESRDADMLMAAHASLQNIVSQASVREDQSPNVIMTTFNTNVADALRDTLNRNTTGITVTTGNPMRVTIVSTGRWADFAVVGGKVRMTGTGGATAFTQYNINAEGDLRRI